MMLKVLYESLTGGAGRFYNRLAQSKRQRGTPICFRGALGFQPRAPFQVMLGDKKEEETLKNIRNGGYS